MTQPAVTTTTTISELVAGHARLADEGPEPGEQQRPARLRRGAAAASWKPTVGRPGRAPAARPTAKATST